MTVNLTDKITLIIISHMARQPVETTEWSRLEYFLYKDGDIRDFWCRLLELSASTSVSANSFHAFIFENVDDIEVVRRLQLRYPHDLLIEKVRLSNVER